MSSYLGPSKLTDHKALIFDVYGTLVDWESGVYAALKPLLSRFPASARWSRKEAILAFTSVETNIQAQEPTLLYSDLLAKVHEVLEARLIASSNLSADDPVKRWPLFPDSSKALHDLAKHFKLIVLSNVDHASFAYTHAYLSEGSGPFEGTTLPNSKSPFSLILTAQDTHAYKPSLEGFNIALEALRTDPSLLGSGPNILTTEEIKSRVLVVAQSLVHDHEPARQLNIQSIWIDRQGAAMRPDDIETSEKKWTWRFETLGEMAKAVQDEINH
ncbi:HAD-like domain-containing protein [Collybia nuda]|uniref:HAD-like domain-containing protein n=1 Tax=Collybia nuda TaxID=64659 RepID=A0A9P5YFA5_9AGAR|nr:HAD-like domain-containing protein [Collybia nuda]